MNCSIVVVFRINFFGGRNNAYEAAPRIKIQNLFTVTILLILIQKCCPNLTDTHSLLFTYPLLAGSQADPWKMTPINK